MTILVADNHEDGMYKCRGELLEELVKMGEVHVSVPEGKYTERFREIGCVFEDLAINRRGMNPVQELKLIAEYAALLKKIHPDIVLTYSVKPNVYLGFLCGIKKVPYIANVTGLGSALQTKGIKQKVILYLYKIGLRKASMVFCQNETNMEFLRKNKVISGPCDLIPGSGVNLRKHCFEEYPPDTEEIRFLTIGRIMKEKGTDELLTAARKVKEKFPKVIFSMIGFYEDDYEDRIKEAEKQGIVLFYGHQDDVHSFIKNSHAIIHPSYHEGMANALLESASAGRPVIATDVPGCREAFTPGVTGLACKVQDAEDLYWAIVKFIELPYSKKVELGKAARRKMEAEFSRDIVIHKYLDQIKRIANC